MIKVAHITNGQLLQLVGSQLSAKLWFTGMMNELRRYPNEIPCEAGEIPSMRIPFASGEEKVEWGFTAGMSCLRQNPDGSILVQNAEHFPSCATLALLSLLHDAGAADGAKISLTLQIPDSPQIIDFKNLLSEAERSLKTVTITKRPLQRQLEQNAHPDRTALGLGNSMGVVRMLKQTDVGRFAAMVRCVNGSFQVGDDLTVTDGSFHVLQEHCPVIQIVSTSDKAVQCSDALDEDDFFVCFAMWFPPNTPPFNSLMIVKEETPPAFSPKAMSNHVVIQGQDHTTFDRELHASNEKGTKETESTSPKSQDGAEKKSFWKRLFSR